MILHLYGIHVHLILVNEKSPNRQSIIFEHGNPFLFHSLFSFPLSVCHEIPGQNHLQMPPGLSRRGGLQRPVRHQRRRHQEELQRQVQGRRGVQGWDTNSKPLLNPKPNLNLGLDQIPDTTEHSFF